ncbi:MFS transporter [Amycolatopsis camponoti]|uniref:MFS transporter n=1 Tax=Amycolatopsis camponoti TaxID=2606593 RepID=UPI001E30E2AB|nr:MFS transporter [Amycolatopsis camponoti]
MGALQNRDFRRLWLADLVSQLGSRIDVLAVPLLAATALGASVFEVSLLRTAESLPYLALGLQVGAWCDRMRHRPVLIAADAGRAVLLGSIPVAALFGVLGLAHLLAVVLGVGLLGVFFDIAHQTYVPRLVTREQLPAHRCVGAVLSGVADPGRRRRADHLGGERGSTINRAHQHAAGARIEGDLQKEPPGGIGEPEPADHALGRSRGGWTTKLHLATEQGQKPLSLLVTAGQPGDSPQFEAVLARGRVARIGGGRARTRPDRVLADKACSSRASRACLRRRGIACTIPQPSAQVRHRRNGGRAVGGHQHSTRRATSSGTRPSAASIGSNATEASPRGSTNSRFATKRLCTSLRSTSGYAIERGSSSRLTREARRRPRGPGAHCPARTARRPSSRR